MQRTGLCLHSLRAVTPEQIHTVLEHWCLIQATHITGQETQHIARSGAVAGLCLTTEANLGYGIFPGLDYLSQQGNWGIGSDSHISVSVSEDLRWLEYGQRLSRRRRNLLHLPDEPYIGNVLYPGALRGGRMALGELAPGARADMLVLDGRDPFLAAAGDRERLNRWLFACSTNPIKEVFVDGRRVIEGGHHAKEDDIARAFIPVMQQLVA